MKGCPSRKEGRDDAPVTLLPLDEHLQVELLRCYEEACSAETRTRYQMLLLAQDGRTSMQIAHLV
jgi:hypothetical protein